MSKKLIYFSLSLLLFGCYTGMKEFSVKQQHKEAKILRTVINEAIGNPYLYHDSLFIDSKLKELEESNSTITNLEWYKKVSAVISSIGCGHTVILPSNSLLNDYVNTNSTFPFEVQFIDGRLYATSSYKNSDKIQIKKGCEILSINGKSIAQALGDMYHLFSSDAFNTSMKDAFFEDFFSLYFFLAYGYQDSYSIQFIDEVQKEWSFQVPPSYPSFKKLMEKFKNNPFMKAPDLKTFGTQKMNLAENYAYLKIPSFMHLGGRKYAEWLNKFFVEVANKEIGNVIIDLRGNLGGLPQTELLGYLIPRNAPVLEMSLPNYEKLHYRKYYKKLNKEYMRYWYIRKVAEKQVEQGAGTYKELYSTPDGYLSKMYAGNLIVLIDGLSFSASANLVSNLKDHRKVLLIGKTTGGSYQQGNTGQLRFELPESDYFMVLNPLFFNNLPKDSVTFDVGIVPDIEIKDEFGQKKSMDREMDAALEWIKTGGKLE